MAFSRRPAVFFLHFSIICGLSVVDGLVSSAEGQEDNDGVHWALIVAGSNGWDNYRHQVQSCSAETVFNHK